MITLSRDTSPAAEQVQLDLFRRAPDWRKLQMTFELNRGLQRLILADLKERFPDDDEATLKRRLADRWLGPALARKAYGEAAR